MISTSVEVDVEGKVVSGYDAHLSLKMIPRKRLSIEMIRTLHLS